MGKHKVRSQANHRTDSNSASRILNQWVKFSKMLKYLKVLRLTHKPRYSVRNHKLRQCNHRSKCTNSSNQEAKCSISRMLLLKPRYSRMAFHFSRQCRKAKTSPR